MSVWQQPDPPNWWHVVDDAIEEDVGSGDVTGGCVDPDLGVEWYIEAQGDGVLAGLGIVEYLLTPYPGDSEETRLTMNSADGERVQRGDRIAEGLLQARRTLIAERTLLNFLMHLSGVATLTSQFVAKVEGTGTQIIDTRKTMPGLRALQKYAVRCGGGHNHRMGLFDGALIKDNHIHACGGITRAIERVRSYASHLIKVEIECRTMEEVEESVEAGADIVLLDNMDPFMMREAVKKFKGDVLFEASGGVNMDTVRGMAQTGVDFISIGALTHSAPALMMHMEFV